MQATEALERVLARAENVGDYLVPGDQEARDAQAKEFSLDDEAIAICRSFQNTAVPLSRFRCFVTIEKIGQKSKLGLGDYVVTATAISGIKNGLVGLSMEKVTILARLWEHTEGGRFDMISGYQGDSKTLQFRNWLADIDRHEVERVASS